MLELDLAMSDNDWGRPGWVGHVLLSLFAAWSLSDGSYVGYNVLVGHNHLREANAYASMLLFLIADFVWAWRGSLREVFRHPAQHSP